MMVTVTHNQSFLKQSTSKCLPKYLHKVEHTVIILTTKSKYLVPPSIVYFSPSSSSSHLISFILLPLDSSMYQTNCYQWKPTLSPFRRKERKNRIQTSLDRHKDQKLNPVFVRMVPVGSPCEPTMDPRKTHNQTWI